MRFNLDFPRGDVISGPTRFSGWYTPPPDEPVNLQLHVDGVSVTTMIYGRIREDVKKVFPTVPGAVRSGFFGDIAFAEDSRRGPEVTIDIVDCGNGRRTLYSRKYAVNGPWMTASTRERTFDLTSLLCCPSCGAGLNVRAEEWTCQECGGRGCVVFGVPQFYAEDALPFLRVAEERATHPYGDNALALLEGTRNGIALDFGAGNTPVDLLRPNVVYLDVQQYANTDLVVRTDRLPFRENTFDAVISQAVFEHLADPHGAARELLRILKPGGMVYIDTAFLQPLHGDPGHYFNMTLHGLRKVAAGFEEIRAGSAPYQGPSFALEMQIDEVLPVMANGYWRDRLRRLLEEIRQRRLEVDEAMGPEGRNILAAGYYFLGRKPG